MSNPPVKKIHSPVTTPDLSRAAVLDAEVRLTTAQTDVEAVRAWLRARGQRSEATFDRYARQGRRLLEFLHSRGESFATMTIETVHAYEQAMMAGHVGSKPLSKQYVDEASVVLSSMFSLLVQSEYIRRNPFVLRERTEPTEDDTSLERYLDNEQLDALFTETDALRDVDPRTEAGLKAARTRFLLLWILITGARISEVLKSPMKGGVVLADDGWVWKIVRKGRKKGEIPLRSDALDALRDYRRCFGYDYSLPSEYEDDAFLILPVRGKSIKPLSRSIIWRDLKEFFARASAHLDSPEKAAKMQRASAHWLRHTAATQLLNEGATMRFVQKLLGHNHVGTTSSIYDHLERKEFRREMEKGRQFR